MKEIFYKTIICATAMAFTFPAPSAHASIEDAVETYGMTCAMIVDQNAQAKLFYKTALQASYNGVDEVMIPVGHFTTYVDAGQAADISKARIKQMRKMALAQGCALSNQKIAMHF